MFKHKQPPASHSCSGPWPPSCRPGPKQPELESRKHFYSFMNKFITHWNRGEGLIWHIILLLLEPIS